VTVFCPRAYREASKPECGQKRILKYREEDMPMSVLKAPPKPRKTTVVQLRLDDQARMQVTKYADFLECSPSYVVTEALKLVCNKDKEFQSWLSSQHTKPSEPTTKGESFKLELK